MTFYSTKKNMNPTAQSNNQSIYPAKKEAEYQFDRQPLNPTP